MSRPGPTLQLVEPTWYGDFHAPFNAGVIDMLARAFPERRIAFASESEHGRRVLDLLPAGVAEALDVVDLQAPRFGNLWAAHRSEALSDRRPARAAWRARRLLTRAVAAHPGPKDLLLTSTTPSTLTAAASMGRRRHGVGDVEVIIHGTLAGLDDGRSRHPLRRALDLRAAVARWVGGGRRLTVLEPHIPDEAARRMPLLARPEALVVIPHPSVESDPAEVAPPPTPPTRIGFAGVITEAKGAPQFLGLAGAFAHRPDLEFRLCGFLPDAVAGVDLDGLGESVPTQPLPRARYDALLSELHYVCLPLPGRYYDLTASGTVLDAIRHLKPLLTLDGPLTRRLFAEAGDIGHLCADESDLRDTVDRLGRAPDPGRYRSQVEAMRRLRDARRPEALAPLARERWFRPRPGHPTPTPETSRS